MSAFILGTINAISAALNGMTGRQLGALRATHIFLAIGAFASIVLAPLLGEASRWEAFAELKPYLLLPGVVNLLFILASITLINRIGAMLIFSCLFIGQLLIGTWLDHIGFLGLITLPVTPQRVIALGVLISGLVLLIINRQNPQLASQVSATSISLRAGASGAALVLGMAVGTATALNAVLGQAVGTLTATSMYLLPGAAFLTAWFHVVHSRPRANYLRPVHALPGIINVVQNAGGILLIPQVGIQAFIATSFAANVMTGMVIDRFGWFEIPTSPITYKRLAAAILLAVGVLLSYLSSKAN